MATRLKLKDRPVVTQEPLGTAQHKQLSSFNVHFHVSNRSFDDIIQADNLALEAEPIRGALVRPPELWNPVIHRYRKCDSSRLVATAAGMHNDIVQAVTLERVTQNAKVGGDGLKAMDLP